ncbi:uncharacterized protein J3D65DRAFT_599002 [Phyllosticta citribraziliensis]|uniref:Uncharacterized protein n=1 Tax=Phyllosticta citribraziliensis TaxID=989973 RepID=A0ABR1MAN5_9PEZI
MSSNIPVTLPPLASGVSPAIVPAVARPSPSSGSASQRRIAVPPPALTTNGLFGSQQQQGTLSLQTSVSAITPSSTPFSPMLASNRGVSLHNSPAPSSASRGTSPMAYRATSMVASYNPQEWSRSGPVSGQYVPHSVSSSAMRGTVEATGMEANLPSPPPPYSPNPRNSLSQSVNPSPVLSGGAFPAPQASGSRIGPLDQGLPITGTPSVGTSGRPRPVGASGTLTSSPALPSAAFPPPPPRNGRDRSSSRPKERNPRFSFSALRSRGGPSEQPVSFNAIDSLQHQTTEALLRTPALNTGAGTMPYEIAPPQRQVPWSPESVGRPPASRRAASTGAIGTSIRNEDHVSQARAAAWEPGMPLPPPPPGPPPSGSRSQSTNRAAELSSRISPAELSMPEPRRPHRHASTLGPIPPTPADWTEEEARNRSRSPCSRSLRVTTADPHQSEQNIAADEFQTAQPATSGSCSDLDRQPALRDPSARGIRERRSESRAARERAGEILTAIEPSNNPWFAAMEPARPANLVLASNEGAISQRRKNKLPTPNSGRDFYSPASGQPSAKSSKSFGDLPRSSHSTPRQTPHRLITCPSAFGFSAPTPPFSPRKEVLEREPRSKTAPAQSLKTLPTSPPHSAPMISTMSSLSTPQDRPLSHILHTPNDNVPMPVPLLPSRSSPSASISVSGSKSLGSGRPTDQEMFATAALERHRSFIERETAAATDQERLELFADFIVNESRLRRDRYSGAFDAMASDILDLTRDMWRSYKTPSTGRRSTTPNMSLDRPTERKDSVSSSVSESQSYASISTSSPGYSPHPQISASESPLSVSSAASHGGSPRFQPGRARGDSQGGWQPCLSPIPSMAMSTVPDEENSRGRSASRWWEGSADGSNGNDRIKLERSKRESKYMGVALSDLAEVQDSFQPEASLPGPSNTAARWPGSSYPPEKIEPPPSSSPSQWEFHGLSSAPSTPDPRKLDVSRLVTLPPPYPRHHPAVNNNHPDLAPIRANLRSFHELEDAKQIKEKYTTTGGALRERGLQGERSRRAELREEISAKVRAGEITFAEAAKAEAEFEVTEAQITQRRVQQEFDMFQKDVMTPLHALLSERVRKATACIEHVRSGLCNDAQMASPNQSLEEGDNQPEILEKLTLLKWLFEARENLHKDLFELEGERNELYKTVVLTPYKAANNTEKMREAEAFFNGDSSERKLSYEKEALLRSEDLLSTIEQNVTRGVEDQLSAFWDIAPGLLAVVQKVPERLSDAFQIAIPAQEMAENPQYADFPLQYLFSVLVHARRSAYQFIESQTNLLCLLHEVKTAAMTANTRLFCTQRTQEGEDGATVEGEIAAIRGDEEERLTLDLKEKVSTVEGQWSEALGKGLEGCMDRVKEFLEDRGGWDESLQE